MNVTMLPGALKEVKGLIEENQALRNQLDRVSRENAELKKLNAIESLPHMPFGLTGVRAMLFRVLMAREVVASEALLHMLHTRRNREYPDIKVLQVHISRIRRTLKTCGATVTCVFDTGYQITREDKAKIREVLAR